MKYKTVQDPTLEQSPKVLRELIHFTGWIENCDPHLTNINQKAIGKSIKESQDQIDYLNIQKYKKNIKSIKQKHENFIMDMQEHCFA